MFHWLKGRRDVGDDGRPEPRKELGRILLAHGNAYVAQTTPAHINHFYRSVMEANEFHGPAVVIAYAACMPEHGIADDAHVRLDPTMGVERAVGRAFMTRADGHRDRPFDRLDDVGEADRFRRP